MRHSCSGAPVTVGQGSGQVRQPCSGFPVTVGQGDGQKRPLCSGVPVTVGQGGDQIRPLCSGVPAREDDLREQLPHTWASSNDIFLKSNFRARSSNSNIFLFLALKCLTNIWQAPVL